MAEASGAQQEDALCTALQTKLQRWASLGEAPEYYNLKNRGPHKPTITHPLNRFGGNMGPYADALLPLRTVEYINASPIDNLGEGAMPFVATMCPKRETFAHFWSMVWELGSRVIINLTHEKDRVGSGPSDKRERYWPPFDEASERHLAKWPVRPYTIGTESCEQVPSLLRYTIELRGPPAGAADAAGGADAARPRRIVYLYWYSRWVDFPSSTSIGSRPFYANAWAVLHIGMHIAQQLDELGHGSFAPPRQTTPTPSEQPPAASAAAAATAAASSGGAASAAGATAEELFEAENLLSGGLGCIGSASSEVAGVPNLAGSAVVFGADIHGGAVALAPPSAPPAAAAATAGGWQFGSGSMATSPSGLRVRTPEDEEMADSPFDQWARDHHAPPHEPHDVADAEMAAEGDGAIDNAADVAHYAGVVGGS